MKQDKPIVPISLVLTVLNARSEISVFLESVRDQSVYPREIVIVDGGSRDGTVEVVRSWVSPAGVSLRVRVEDGANISRGRNVAIEWAGGEYIAISDAGARLAPQWIERLFQSLESGADVASGFFTVGGDTFWERAIGAVTVPTLQEINPSHFLPSSRSVAMRRSAWVAGGRYPEWLDYCEDLVLDLEMRRAGLTFDFVPAAYVAWDARPSLPAFARQYYRYARGDGKANLWPRRHAIRYASYLTGIALLITGVFFPLVLVALLGLGLCYLAKFFLRVVRARAILGTSTLVVMLLVPVVVMVGDIAKMAGYPVGRAWRARAGSA